MLERLTCAAPAYLERFGVPADPTALDGHRMIGLRVAHDRQGRGRSSS